MIRGINAYAGLTHPEAPTLFMEFSGTREEVEGQLRRVEALVRAGGGRILRGRRMPGSGRLSGTPGTMRTTRRRGCARGAVKRTDVCVPLSRLAECLARVQADMAGTFLMAPLVGHVGDGNFHLQYLIDPERPEEVAESSGCTSSWSATRSNWAAPARANTAWGSARRDSWPPSTAKPCTSCTRSSRRWTLRGC
ncbi:MAG: FAD-linked oxidase C-terminal domain-containing protein [Rhodothermales bacterium]